LTGTPLSTGIAAHLITVIGQKRTNSRQDNIEFKIVFLKHVLEFSKAQDSRGMGEIEKYYDLKTNSEKIKPAPMQTEEERQAESMAELVKENKKRASGLDAMAETGELDNKELVSMMKRKAIGVGPEAENVFGEGDNLETVTAGCEFCKIAECMWLANREFVISCELGNLPDHRLHSARELAKRWRFAVYCHMARIMAEIVASKNGVRLLRLPRCVVIGIRTAFPDPDGRYGTAL
jgi:hypothetical protein